MKSVFLAMLPNSLLLWKWYLTVYFETWQPQEINCAILKLSSPSTPPIGIILLNGILFHYFLYLFSALCGSKAISRQSNGWKGYLREYNLIFLTLEIKNLFQMRIFFVKEFACIYFKYYSEVLIILAEIFLGKNIIIKKKVIIVCPIV